MTDNNKIVLTGIKPTGTPHLGNYIGALKPLIEMAEMHRTFVFIADLHALNSIRNPKDIQQHSYEIAAMLIALGLNLDNAFLFRQSDVAAIYQLSSFLMNVTPKGLMNRAHSYKAIVEKNTESGIDIDSGVNMGLYTYPVLMSADILVYNADVVPVLEEAVALIDGVVDDLSRQVLGDEFVFHPRPEEDGVIPAVERLLGQPVENGGLLRFRRGRLQNSSDHFVRQNTIT